MITNILKRYPKLNLSVTPTPIQKLGALSGKFKTNIYCMRDDLTGFAFGGNKTRKLDYLMADAKQKGKDTIIGIGANQSNFCRMATAAATVNGMETHLVLAGNEPETPTGNLLVDHLFGAIIHHTDTENVEVLTERAAELEKQLKTQGKRVYNMPSGGSTPIGILGYVSAFDEILEFQRKQGILFDAIFFASGSGGTQAGLVLGQQLTNWKGKIIGINVGFAKEQMEYIVEGHVKSTANMIAKEIVPNEIIVDANFIGDAYGVKTNGGKEAIELFAKSEGILLDYVYTGKAAAGMIEYLRSGKINRSENILFIHTGGNIELFE
jgi:D-cysteine desulfhydrase